MQTFINLLFVVQMLICAGCSHSIRIKAIDSKTGKPLEGVFTSWVQHRDDWILGEGDKPVKNLPLTAEDGNVRISGIATRALGWESSFILSHGGYANVYANYPYKGLTYKIQTKKWPVPPIYTNFAVNSSDTLITLTNNSFVTNWDEYNDARSGSSIKEFRAIKSRGYYLILMSKLPLE